MRVPEQIQEVLYLNITAETRLTIISIIRLSILMINGKKVMFKISIPKFGKLNTPC